MQSAHFVVGRLYQIVPHPTTGLVGDGKAISMNPPHDHAGCPTSSTTSSNSGGSASPIQTSTRPTPAWADPPHPRATPSTRAAGRYVFRYGLVPHDPVQGEGGGDRDASDQLSAPPWVRGVVELGGGKCAGRIVTAATTLVGMYTTPRASTSNLYPPETTSQVRHNKFELVREMARSRMSRPITFPSPGTSPSGRWV